MTAVNILLSSAGRRPYLVKWFREALVMNRVGGKVIVADLAPLAPARGLADTFIKAPNVDDPAYSAWLAALLQEQEVHLAISLNDFELSEWSRLDTHTTRFNPLVRLSAETQEMVEDKHSMATHLIASGIRVPDTILPLDGWTGGPSEIVVKGRFGSGSRGLSFTDKDGLEFAVAVAAREVTDRSGRRSDRDDATRRLIVLQERIQGHEFGLDIVNSLDGQFEAVLARRKLLMRGGETDKAITVDPEAFWSLGRQVSQALGHPGILDADVLVDDGGRIWLIDVNPRFGGGYPFSHVAGAHVPAAYVSWLLTKAANEDWLASQVGVEGAKYVGVAVTGDAVDRAVHEER